MNPVVIYGIKFDYNEALIIRNNKEYKKHEYKEHTSSKIFSLDGDPDYFLSAWDSFYSEFPFYSKYKGVCFRTTNPRYECKNTDKEYYIGVDITYKSLQAIKSLDTESINDKIINICKEYSLPYENKTLIIHYTVHDN